VTPYLLLLFLSLLGAYSLTLGSALLSLAEPSWPAKLAALPASGWALLCGRCATDVLFNGLIVYSIYLSISISVYMYMYKYRG